MSWGLSAQNEETFQVPLIADIEVDEVFWNIAMLEVLVVALSDSVQMLVLAVGVLVAVLLADMAVVFALVMREELSVMWAESVADVAALVLVVELDV
mmetsp:Transcript_61957/g.202048  ORF Transcript_61957/g.202048 Transcript_61957/m.202048 type:complete len:97 (+) Transcript_61957:2556-2846(+)